MVELELRTASLGKNGKGSRMSFYQNQNKNLVQAAVVDGL